MGTLGAEGPVLQTQWNVWILVRAGKRAREGQFVFKGSRFMAELHVASCFDPS